MVDLLNILSKFEPFNNRESDAALFQTQVPWVAPEAYLNIIFKPAPSDLLADVSVRMKAPAPVTELLSQHNGGMFLSEALSVYGVVPKGQMLNRSDRFSLPPFNIEAENRSWPPPDSDRFLKIGGYGFDGSDACIDRTNLHIFVFRRGEKKPYCSWPSVDEWLNSELSRLIELFDLTGRRLVDESMTLPSQGAQG